MCARVEFYFALVRFVWITWIFSPIVSRLCLGRLRTPCRVPKRILLERKSDIIDVQAPCEGKSVDTAACRCHGDQNPAESEKTWNAAKKMLCLKVSNTEGRRFVRSYFGWEWL